MCNYVAYNRFYKLCFFTFIAYNTSTTVLRVIYRSPAYVYCDLELMSVTRASMWNSYLYSMSYIFSPAISSPAFFGSAFSAPRESLLKENNSSHGNVVLFYNIQDTQRFNVQLKADTRPISVTKDIEIKKIKWHKQKTLSMKIVYRNMA